MLWKRGCVLGLQVCGLDLEGCGLVNITDNIWLSALGLLQSKLKMKLLEVEGARAPVPHSWRRPLLPISSFPYIFLSFPTPPYSLYVFIPYP